MGTAVLPFHSLVQTPFCPSLLPLILTVLPHYFDYFQSRAAQICVLKTCSL